MVYPSAATWRPVGPGGAAGAGAIFHDHRLAQALLQLGRDQARQRIYGAARRERHDDAHGLGWVGLRVCPRTANVSAPTTIEHATLRYLIRSPLVLVATILLFVEPIPQSDRENSHSAALRAALPWAETR